MSSFRRNRVLIAPVVFALGICICASMTTQTVFYVLSSDPLLGRSHNIHHIRLDIESMNDYQPGSEPAEQLSRFDTAALLQDAREKR